MPPPRVRVLACSRPQMLREYKEQLDELQNERDALKMQLESSSPEADLNRLKLELSGKRTALDVSNAKYEQLQGNFHALKANHEKALSEIDAHNKELLASKRRARALARPRSARVPRAPVGTRALRAWAVLC